MMLLLLLHHLLLVMLVLQTAMKICKLMGMLLNVMTVVEGHLGASTHVCVRRGEGWQLVHLV
jgi:hypothetical protein